MKYAGSASWEINLRASDRQLVTALWIRAAERIDVPAEGVVTAPLDIDPAPEPSVVPDEASAAWLNEAWLHWWHALVFRPPLTEQNVRTEMARFGPPEFPELTDFPDLRRVVVSRWQEAHAWSPRKKGLGQGTSGIEGQVVRAVEAELGRSAAPFSIRIVLLPVAEDVVRPTGDGMFLVPDRFRRTAAYAVWLAGVVRELA